MQLFAYLEIEVAEVLIKYGADIDFMDGYNRTPLIRAMSRGKTIKEQFTIVTKFVMTLKVLV